MKFKVFFEKTELLNELGWGMGGKYMGGKGAMYCARCKGELTPNEMTENPNHIFKHGQLFACKCGDSKIWTNSLRDMDKFKQYLQGDADSYKTGFCCDLFCGHCLQPNSMKWMENDGNWNGIEKVDTIGCKSCPQNQDIKIVKMLGTNRDMMNWYSDKIKVDKKPGLMKRLYRMFNYTGPHG